MNKKQIKQLVESKPDITIEELIDVFTKPRIKKKNTFTRRNENLFTAKGKIYCSEYTGIINPLKLDISNLKKEVQHG